MYRLTAPIAATLALTLAAGAQECITQWTVRDIFADANLPTAQGNAADIDNGWVTVQRWNDPFGEHAYRYNVILRQLDSLGDLGSSWGAVGSGSATNLACGYSGTPNGESHPFVWSANTSRNLQAGMNDLGTLSNGNLSVAVDVNNAGNVAGWGFDPDGSQRAVFWHPAYSTSTLVPTWTTGMLRLPGGSESEAVGVAGDSNNPYVVGKVDGQAAVWDMTYFPPVSFLRRSTYIVEPPRLLSAFGTSTSSASDITNNGTNIVGSAVNTAGNRQAVRWTRHLGPGFGLNLTTPLPGLNGTSSNALAINDSGHIVGTAKNFFGQNRAVMWVNNAITDLNTLLDPSDGWVLEYATAIDESGRICGRGTKNGQTRPFVMWPDADEDNVPDMVDNCPCTPNHGQIDADNDGIGNECDNCQLSFNPDQTDDNNNGIGDDCENVAGDYDGDGNTTIADLLAYLGDYFPANPNADSNNDGIITVADLLVFLSEWFAGT